MHLVRWALVAGVAAAATAAGQTRILETTVQLRDFGFSSVRDVRAAEVTMTGMGEGASMNLTALSGHAERTAAAGRSAAPPVRTGEPRVRLHRATWVWNTDRLLKDGPLRSAFLRFLREEEFDVVYLQIPRGDDDTAHGVHVLPAADLLPLIRTMRSLGVSVEALAGDPRFILPAGRRTLLSLIGSVAAYDRGVPADARFSAVHLDVEPYLLPGFGGPRRTRLLTAYLDLLRDVRTAAQAAGLALGVDVPSWFDEGDELSGEPFEADEHGTRRPVLDLLLPLVDEVCVMSYQTTAAGPGGVLASSAGELRAAGKSGKQVSVALETTPLPDQTVAIVRGAPARGYPLRNTGADQLLLFPRRDSVSVWYVPSSAADSALGLLRKRKIADSSCAVWTVPRRAEVPASGITFAGSSADELQKVETEVRRAFAGEPGFAGTAVHDWMNYFNLRHEVRAGGKETEKR